MSGTKRRWHPWPVGIVVYFACFAALCVVFAIKASKVRIDLVSDDYYAKGVAHTDRMAALSRAQALNPRPVIRLEGQRLEITLPETAREAVLTLYRAADARLDRVHPLPAPASTLPLPDLAPGRWQAQVAWKQGELDYYMEEVIFAP